MGFVRFYKRRWFQQMSWAGDYPVDGEEIWARHLVYDGEYKRETLV
jgi:hypothetical protein